MRRREISTAARAERRLRDAAIEEAAALFQRHGAGAVGIVSDRLIDPDRTREQRRSDRLTLLEVERLDRDRRQGSANAALVVWRPPLLSWRGVLSRLGFGAGRR